MAAYNIVQKSIVFKDQELNFIDDFGILKIPRNTNCEDGELVYLQVAIFINGELHINNFLWNEMSPIDQVGLLFHEALYFYLRAFLNSKTSEEARKIVGLLFSDVPLSRLEDYLSKVVNHH